MTINRDVLEYGFGFFDKPGETMLMVAYVVQWATDLSVWDVYVCTETGDVLMGEGWSLNEAVGTVKDIIGKDGPWWIEVIEI